MPDRMYREGWLTSQRINALDTNAELFLFRLGLKVDKNGVYHGEPELLRAAVFPMKLSTTRVSWVLSWRDACLAAGLLRLYVAADGRPYVQILKWGQKTPMEKPRYPLPPGNPDESGQEQLPLEEARPRDPPAAEVNRIERKRRGGARCAPKPPPPAIAETESDEAWLDRLSREWPAVDVRLQLDLAAANRRKLGKQLERGWFVEEWLSKCTRTVALGRRPPWEGEPSGWRDFVEQCWCDRRFVLDGRHREGAWLSLPASVRKEIREAMQEVRDA